MTINIPCWTTSKEEADKLVDELSEVCFEYGKDESKEKMLDVFYKTKMLKNYVGIMQGRIELLTARIAELGADNAEFRQLIRDWSIVLDQNNGFQLWHVESVRQAMLEINKECEE